MGSNFYQAKHKFKIIPRLIVGIGLVALECCLAFAQCTPQRAPAQIEDQSASLQLIVVQETSEPHFRVELNNVGNQPLILILGMMLANGRRLYADRINLVLTGPDGQLLHLEMTGPGIIGGRVDPMVVPLPVGASFVLPIDLKDYIAPKEKIWNLNLPPGQYALCAEYTGAGVSQLAANLDMKGIALMPYWTGTARSNTFRFTLHEEIGSPRAQ